MYYPQAPKESGCMDSLVIMKVIIGMLVIPVAFILGAILFIVLLFIALAESPWLGLLVLVIGAGILFAAGIREWKQVSKQIRRDDR
jgi:hypothetical protein